jgi:SH3-like domain-containing protein
VSFAIFIIQILAEPQRIKQRYRLNMREIFSKLVNRRLALGVAAIALSGGITGCSHFRIKPQEKYVYVTAKQTFLRDRVAAVSNRVGTASNGEKLVVLDRARRFLKVQAPQGEVGWIEERLTAGQDVADKFEALGKEHEKDPVVATATASDEVYLHVAPGRETERFYLLAENDSLNLLERAAVPKPATPGALPAVKLADKESAPPAPAMEDWWLVRDTKGHTGWIYGRMIDVSAPDALLRYAEGQRIVGAYVLAHVNDPDSGLLDNGNTVTSIPEYVTVLSPYKAGLPYDFNQVRVFVWNTRKHRYETGFREHNIVGYLPVQIAMKTDPYGKNADSVEKLPSFSYRVLAGNQVIPVPDSATGLIKPGKTIEKTYRLEGNICRRLIAPGAEPPEEAHPDPEVETKSKGRKRQRK